MKLRPLGRSGLQVSALCLGGNVFGWTADEPASFAVLDAFVDAGGSFIDTADVYSRWVPGHAGGESETVIGKWLARSGKRNRVFIATKVGMDMGGEHKGLGTAHIVASVESSLRRLQTDRIDLYQSHTDDTTVPIEETLRAYQRLIEAGKVRVIGASNYSAERLQEALAISSTHGLPRYESLQNLYNLIDRQAFESALQALCQREGVGVIPFYALASGFLTGKYRNEADVSKSARGKNAVAKYLNPRGLKILAALDEVAAKTGHPHGMIAIAWLSARPGMTAPIASATSVAQVQALVAGIELQLDTQSLAALDAASA